MARMSALWKRDEDLYARLKGHYDGKEENNDLIGQSEVLIYSLKSLQTRITKTMPSGIPKRSESDFSAKIKAYEGRLTSSQKTTLEGFERSFARIAPDLHTEDDLIEAADTIGNLETDRDDIRLLIRDCIQITGPGYPFALERMITPSYSLAVGVGNPNKLTLGMSFLPDWSFYEGSTQIKDVNMQIQYKAIPVGDLFFLDGSTQQKTVWMLERLLTVY
jgi:hypothetical protein